MVDKKALLFVLGLLLGGCILVLGYYYAAESPFHIRMSDARARLAKGEFTTVLDVRTDLEYWAGHYPGAVHIPTTRLLEEAYNMLPNLEEKILVYCNTGQRSRHATEVLRSLGYKNVFYITTAHWTLL
jgi:phage shock protein E